MSCVIIPCRENFYSLPREIFFPAERVKKDRAHPIFGVIYIQGDISRQLAPKGQLSTAQGTALGIRKLRTMRPVRAALTFLCFFTVALTIIFADEKKEEKISFILYTFVKFALVTEQKLNIEEYSISSVNPVPFQA